jgi:uncharacterized protein YeaO (DUF488 family)
MKIFTIGFTQKSAEQFFTILASDPAIKRVVDIRFSNNTTLAGYTKKDSLKFFLDKINGQGYYHRLDLAPSKELMNTCKNNPNITFEEYSAIFNKILQDRKVERLPKNLLDGSVLLCAEPKASECHRSIVAEYYKTHWDDVEIIHL